ncbi:hypothetical protein CCMSSC00406_0008938 [Pleurotus cornucopiae]|uniref:Uncharacterized protein n=1 Tax=Pleurotus cornucopiae TaxID=5321 RepID=A0ACB7IYK5_PLECO|nr:hypothetical protein CCMSSC00406_0008938 [Pleurotus cornucopiae]
MPYHATSSRRPHTSPSSSSPTKFMKVFSSIKKKAVALVSPSPSPSFPIAPPVSHRYNLDHASKGYRPGSSLHRKRSPPYIPPNAESMRKHGLANFPRPPRFPPALGHTPSSSTSSASSFATASSSISPSPSTSTTLVSSKRRYRKQPPGLDVDLCLVSDIHRPLSPEQQQIAHLQDQITALQRALSPPPHHTIAAIPEEQSGTDSDSMCSADYTLLPTHRRSTQSAYIKGLVEPARRSSVILALNSSSRPSSSDSNKSSRSRGKSTILDEKRSDPVVEEREVYDPFAKDTVEIVHALPTFCTSVSARGNVRSILPLLERMLTIIVLQRSRPSSGAFTISNVSNTARDLLLSPITEISVIPLPDGDSSSSSSSSPISLPSSKSTKRNSVVSLGQSTIPPPSFPLPMLPSMAPTSSPLMSSYSTFLPPNDDEPVVHDESKGDEWTLDLGALNRPVNMHGSPKDEEAKPLVEGAEEAVDWTLHIPTPTYSYSSPTHRRKESYLDMTDPEQWPSPPASPPPSIRAPSVRSVRSRSKSRTRVNGDGWAYDSPRAAAPPLPSLSPSFVSLPRSTPPPSSFSAKSTLTRSGSRSSRTSSQSITSASPAVGKRASRILSIYTRKNNDANESGWF